MNNANVWDQLEHFTIGNDDGQKFYNEDVEDLDANAIADIFVWNRVLNKTEFKALSLPNNDLEIERTNPDLNRIDVVFDSEVLQVETHRLGGHGFLHPEARKG